MKHEMHEKAILESKSYQIFRSNNEWLNTHIQLVDAALVNAIRTLKTYPKKDKSIGYALSSADYEKYKEVYGSEIGFSEFFKKSIKS